MTETEKAIWESAGIVFGILSELLTDGELSMRREPMAVVYTWRVRTGLVEREASVGVSHKELAMLCFPKNFATRIAERWIDQAMAVSR